MQTGRPRICKFGKANSDDYFNDEQHNESFEKITAKQRQETNKVVRKRSNNRERKQLWGKMDVMPTIFETNDCHIKSAGTTVCGESGVTHGDAGSAIKSRGASGINSSRDSKSRGKMR